MPELPEVETIRRELAASVTGKTISRVRIFHALVVRQGQKGFCAGLQGRKVEGVLRKGKLLLFELSGGKALAVHLKMTGQLVYPGGKAAPRVRIEFTDGSSLDYRDQRMFGELSLVDSWQEMPFVKALGPEPFHLTQAVFSRMLAGRRTRIKPLLLDQKFIAGIGNLYAAEALFAAGIHPARQAGSLTGGEKQRLFTQLKRILASAIAHKGSSLDQYVRTDGSKGGYVRFHRVYGREGRPCRKCRGEVVRVSLSGRGTYFCPNCQRIR